MSSQILNQLTSVVSKWGQLRIIVIGDSGIDEYVTGEVRRISPEAPVPVVEADRENRTLGLAANVAQNIRTLGGEPFLISVVGKDSGAEILANMLLQGGMSSEGLVADEGRPTTRKVRITARTWRGDENHMLRLDYEKRHYLTPEVEAKILGIYELALKSCDLVILQDYAKGMITESFAQQVINKGHSVGVKVLVDPHRTTPLKFYRGADLIKPNFEEAMALTGNSLDSHRRPPDFVTQLGREILQQTTAHQVVITEGPEGMSLFMGDGQYAHVPTYAQQVFDVTGAGDTVIATIALALASGEGLFQACQLANFAAGVVVAKYGCLPCTSQELITYMKKNGPFS